MAPLDLLGEYSELVPRHQFACHILMYIIYIFIYSKTPCRGDVYDQDYFHGDYSFATNDVILLVSHLDTTLTEDSYLQLTIRGVVSNKTKWVSPETMFGPASVEGERASMTERIVVTWENPSEPHVIDAISTTGNPNVPPAYYDVDYITSQAENATNSVHTGSYIEEDASGHRLLSSEEGDSDAPSLPDVPHHGEVCLLHLLACVVCFILLTNLILVNLS